MKNLQSIIFSVTDRSIFFDRANSFEITQFINKCDAQLSAKPPSAYLDFLETSNGAAGNGVFLYSTKRIPFSDCSGENSEFVETNLNLRDLPWMNQYLVFADSDMDYYVLDLSTGNYQLRDRQAFDNIYEEFDSFNQMLSHILSAMVEN